MALSTYGKDVNSNTNCATTNAASIPEHATLLDLDSRQPSLAMNTGQTWGTPSTESDRFDDGLQTPPPEPFDSPELSSILASIFSTDPLSSRPNHPEHPTPSASSRTSVWLSGFPGASLHSTYRHSFSFVPGGFVVDGTTTILNTGSLPSSSMAAPYVTGSLSTPVTPLSKSTALPSSVARTTQTGHVSMEHASTDGTLNTPSHKPLTSESLSTCYAPNGNESCLCHDNVCLGSIPTSASPSSAIPTVTNSSSSVETAATAAPTVAIVAPVAIAGAIILLLLLPCALRRISLNISTKFNRVCPLDDLYGGIAAIWTKLRLTRHRNRDIRKRTTSGTYSLPTTSRTEKIEDDPSVSSATVTGENSSYLGKWRHEQEMKLQETRQKQLREGNWGGSIKEFDREVERSRTLELKRVREERETGAWMGGNNQGDTDP